MLLNNRPCCCWKVLLTAFIEVHSMKCIRQSAEAFARLPVAIHTLLLLLLPYVLHYHAMPCHLGAALTCRRSYDSSDDIATYNVLLLLLLLLCRPCHP
jgi:hypothetical protein